MDPAKEKDIEDEYLSSLMDLNVNSKPLINMLTMLAEDNLENASVIVRAVEKHLAKVAPDVKLPILYLIDSIVKNVGDKYKQLFAQNIVNMFCGVFEKVNEKVREKMFNLRQTWNEVFPQTKLYALDVKVNVMDTNWPITAKIVPKSVHVNPNFLKTQPPPNPEAKAKEDILNQMKAKERELLELKQRKIELELMVTKKKIAESEKEIRGIPQMPAALVQPLAMQPGSLISGVATPQQHVLPSGRMRIAPVNPAMVSSARSRDPRLMRMRQPGTTQSSHQPANQQPIVLTSSVAKSMPRIPKLSQSNNNHKTSSRDSERDRDPRSRRNKEKEESKSSKSSPGSKDKSKSSSSKSSSNDRKKSGSSDDSSPRKKSEEEKKSSKSSSHRPHSRHHSSKTAEAQDVDLRTPFDVAMKPDSTTSTKDKLLSDLLNGENMKSSHELITSDENEEALDEAEAMGDVDLRFAEGGKKRSMSGEPVESEPLTKKNRAENDSLFGDVDLRTPSDVVEKKPKSKEKADFEAVRAKLNATKEKAKLRPGIKILDEFPQMPPSENGQSDLMRKILGRKERVKETVKEREPSPISNMQVETAPVEVPAGPPPSKHSRFSPLDKEDKVDDVADLGNLTAADLRKSSEVPASLRNDKKRKGSKWSQPTWPMNANVRPPMMQSLPPPQHMMPQHFVNPWESNPTVMAMQAQSQMPLVVPQSTSHPILNNKMRTLRLDGTKDHLLRFYNETAVIFNDIGEPHDIKFSSGQSRVVIDDQFSIDLNFNDTYKAFFIDGTLHQIKFGSPTRELYIDQHFYECYFNNQPTQIVLNDKLRRVRIEGNAPEVKIGRKRNDLVLGLINIVIDAEAVVPVFLDTSVQYFEFKGKILTLQFADFFLSVVINNEAFKVEFGGLPKNYTLNGQKHFIRFTGLPDSVNPGRVNLRGMRRTNLFRNCKSPPIIEPLEQENLDINQMVENDMRVDSTPMNNSLPPNVIPGIGNEAQGAPAIGVGNLDINDLLKALLDKGIIQSGAETAKSAKPAEVKEKSPERVEEVRKPVIRVDEKRSLIIPVLLSRPDTIKKRQQAIVDTLYSGIQCSSCGLRFPPEQTMKYSQHLDWHFRQNRRERDSKRRAHFRKWYYNQSDWIKYEEIEDLEEREKNFFETQQMESMQMDQGEDSNAARTNVENSAPISCPAGPEDDKRACDMCHDEFDTFYNNETEEWHLRSALKIDDKFYHPICYEDYKASLTLDESELNDVSAKHQEEEDDDDDIEMKDEVLIKQETSEFKKPETSTAEDDDDVIVLPTEDPVVTEIVDESEVNPKSDLNITDDDVMIQEPNIETQLVLDDDDDDYQPSSTSNDLSFVVKIKEEPRDDGYDDVGNDEDPFVEVTAIANDDLIDDAYTNSPKAPFQPAQDENALFDDSSLLMMPSPQNYDDHSRDVDDENNSRPDSSGPTIGVTKKPKIVLSSLAQTNLSNKNLNTNVIEQNENSILDSVNKLDSNSVELQSEAPKDQPQSRDMQEEPEIEYQVKPSLQGIKFEKIKVPVKRGLENSGLCSIM